VFNAEEVMLKRLFGYGVVFVALGLLLGRMMITSENYMPWLIAFFSYVVLGGIIGNWYVTFGGGKVSFKKALVWLALNGIVALMIALGYMMITHQL
jgi:hypothetical protein